MKHLSTRCVHGCCNNECCNNANMPNRNKWCPTYVGHNARQGEKNIYSPDTFKCVLFCLNNLKNKKRKTYNNLLDSKKTLSNLFIFIFSTSNV